MGHETYSGEIPITVEVNEDGKATAKIDEIKVPLDSLSAEKLRAGKIPKDTLDTLLKIYGEVGNHSRHYSTVRMAATSLLFTIAILISVRGAADLFDDKCNITLLAVIPTSIFILIIALNKYYGRLTYAMTLIQRQIENIVIHQNGIPNNCAGIFPGDFMRRRWKKINPEPSTVNYGEDTNTFIEQYNSNVKVTSWVFDGPFWFVIVAIILYYAVVLAPNVINRFDFIPNTLLSNLCSSSTSGGSGSPKPPGTENSPEDVQDGTGAPPPAGGAAPR